MRGGATLLHAPVSTRMCMLKASSGCGVGCGCVCTCVCVRMCCKVVCRCVCARVCVCVSVHTVLQGSGLRVAVPRVLVRPGV